MLLFITENNLIYAINETIDKEQAQAYLSNHCIWVENMTPSIPEPQENKTLEMYLKDDNTIEYIFEVIEPDAPIPEPVLPTETELIIMAAQAELFEHQMSIEEQNLTIMSAQAEMYELLIPKESEVI